MSIDARGWSHLQYFADALISSDQSDTAIRKIAALYDKFDDPCDEDLRRSRDQLVDAFRRHDRNGGPLDVKLEQVETYLEGLLKQSRGSQAARYALAALRASRRAASTRSPVTPGSSENAEPPEGLAGALPDLNF